MNNPTDRQTPPELLTKVLIRRHYLPAGQRTLDRWIASGQFPRPDIRLGCKVLYWRRETVENWIDRQSGKGGPTNG